MSEDDYSVGEPLRQDGEGNDKEKGDGIGNESTLESKRGGSSVGESGEPHPLSREGWGFPRSLPGGWTGADQRHPLRKTEGIVVPPPFVERVPAIALKDAPEPPPRKWVVAGLVPEKASTAIYGAGGTAKSLLALSLCVSVTLPQPTWLGMEVEGGAALFVDFELEADEARRRSMALCRGQGYNELPNELYYMSGRGASSEGTFWSAYNVCDLNAVKLLVIDSFNFAMDGEINSNTEVKQFYRDMIEPFEEEGIAVLMVDHQPTVRGDGRYQSMKRIGASFKDWAARSTLQVEPIEDDGSARLGVKSLIARQDKTNFAQEMLPFGIEVAWRGDEIQVHRSELGPEQKAKEGSINQSDRVMFAMEVLGDGTEKDVADYCEISAKTAHALLSRLESRGKVLDTGARRYQKKVYEAARHEPSPVRFSDEL